MAKFCTNCGKPLDDGQVFCTECGTRFSENKDDVDIKKNDEVESAPEPQSEAEIVIPVEPKVEEPQPTQPKVEEPQPVQPKVEEPQPVQPTQQTAAGNTTSNVDLNEAKPAKGGKYSVVGTGSFFGLMLLFALPCIGWIICLIFAIVDKNENRKHFARANLIWLAVGFVLLLISIMLIMFLGTVLLDKLASESGGILGEWLEKIKELFNGSHGDADNVGDLTGYIITSVKNIL